MQNKPSPSSGVKAAAYHRSLLDAARFFNQKDFETARQIYAHAMALAPVGDSRAAKELCRCYRKLALKALKQEDFAAVLQLLDAMLAIEPAKAYFKALDYKVLAESALELGQIDRAQTAFDQALMMQPELASDLAPSLRKIKTERLAQEMQGLH